MQSTHNEIHAAVTFEAGVLFAIIHAPPACHLHVHVLCRTMGQTPLERSAPHTYGAKSERVFIIYGLI